jgi:Holliday junction resolvase-like predicted endonuclease
LVTKSNAFDGTTSGKGELKKTMSTPKKNLGDFGESTLDNWFQQQGWETLWQNHRFKGGEIDRVYGLRLADKYGHICIAEVKTRKFRSESFFQTFCFYHGLLSGVPQRQLRNLTREAIRCSTKFPEAKIHLRVFRVFAFHSEAATCDSFEFAREFYGVDTSKGIQRELEGANVHEPKLVALNSCSFFVSFFPDFSH